MYIWKCQKRKGSYCSQYLDVFSGRHVEKFFAPSKHEDPEQAAKGWVWKEVSKLYGAHRAIYVLTIPHFVERFKVDRCRVALTRRLSRGKAYPVAAVTWMDINDGKSVRRWKRFKLPITTCKAEVRAREHEIHLWSVKKRSECAMSRIAPEVFSFEYDLAAPTRGVPTDIKALIEGPL